MTIDEDAVIRLFSEIVPLDDDQMSVETRLDCFTLDELDYAEIATQVEVQFGVVLVRDEFDDLVTIGDLRNVIVSKSG